MIPGIWVDLLTVYLPLLVAYGTLLWRIHRISSAIEVTERRHHRMEERVMRIQALTESLPDVQRDLAVVAARLGEPRSRVAPSDAQGRHASS